MSDPFVCSLAFSAKDYVGATKLYSDAITLNPRDPIFVRRFAASATVLSDAVELTRATLTRGSSQIVPCPR